MSSAVLGLYRFRHQLGMVKLSSQQSEAVNSFLDDESNLRSSASFSARRPQSNMQSLRSTAA